MHEEGCPVVARCREDYVYVGQSEGGPVHTFCDTCPRRAAERYDTHDAITGELIERES